MPIVLFILIAGLWAAFLLPSFFDSRSHAPKATTRDFARTKEKLANIARSQPDSDTYIRHHAQVRRRQILIVLAVASVATLVFATWTGSVPWLAVNIAVNISIAGYVALLLTIKQRRALQRQIVVSITDTAQQRALVAVPINQATPPTKTPPSASSPARRSSRVPRVPQRQNGHLQPTERPTEPTLVESLPRPVS